VWARLTQTEYNHVCANDDGAHGSREELADTSQHHDHTDRDVDETAIDLLVPTLVPCLLGIHRRDSWRMPRWDARDDIQDVGEVHCDGVFASFYLNRGDLQSLEV
jgi:hypothetical protein